MIIKCKTCQTEYKWASNRGKIYCSIKCRSNDPDFKKKVVGNLLMKSKNFTPEIRKKLSDVKKGKKPIYMQDKEKHQRAIKKMAKTKTGMSSARKGMKQPQTTGEKNWQWKGDGVSYRNLHRWARRKMEKTERCVVCASRGGERGCHLANITGNYNRELKNWLILCPRCHKAWDTGNLPINLYEWANRVNEKGGEGDFIPISP